MIKRLANEIKYKRLVWFVELIIWLFILSLISTVIVVSKYYYKKDFNTYQIFLQDIDGLIVGSPVKMMGVQVGYVNKINMIEDLIYIKFIVTEKDVKIPRCSVVTVEFSGMGGSRSLEIYPQQQSCSEEILIAKSPTRLGQAVGMLYDIFNKIGKVSYRITSFSKSLQGISKENNNNLNLKETLKNTNNRLDKTMKKEQKLNKKLKEWENE